MKKQSYLWFLTAICLLVGLSLVYSSSFLGLSWDWLFEDLERLERFALFLVSLTLILGLLLFFFGQILRYVLTKQVERNLRSILAGQKLESLGTGQLDSLFAEVKDHYQTMTKSIQKRENQVLEQEQTIVEKERKRIARDLHDTVSQELFAASMIVSGLESQMKKQENPLFLSQMTGVAALLDTAQKDLRILLLHLRPRELEGKSLAEGLQILLQEVEDKSELEVHLSLEVDSLPRPIEEHIFRISQEIISNTLRHARASRLDLYLYQTSQEVVFKMVDDGIGFEPQEDRVSYGLKNIAERVEDMAGSLQILAAPKQGVAIEIRIPLLEGENDENFID